MKRRALSPDKRWRAWPIRLRFLEMRGSRLLAILLLSAGALVFRANAADLPVGTNGLVELKGRVVSMPNSTNLQFKVEAGSTYKLLPSRDARALFEDRSLHSKVLIVKGRLHPKDSAVEVIGKLLEARDGKTYELYYYCDICSIETSFPGPCLCCREDVVLREREVKR